MITCTNLKEELIHAIQYDRYSSNMTTSIRNYEYEAKVFQDLACYYDGCAYLGGQGPYYDDYRNWLFSIDQNGVTIADYDQFVSLFYFLNFYYHLIVKISLTIS